MSYADYTRRKFLQHTALGTLAAALPGLSLAEDRPINDKPDPAFKPDVEVELIAQIAEVSILPGANTRVFSIPGQVT